MIVTWKLPILPYRLTAPAQPTQLADLLANPIIDHHARTDVTTYFTRAEKKSKPNTVVVLYARSY